MSNNDCEGVCEDHCPPTEGTPVSTEATPNLDRFKLDMIRDLVTPIATRKSHADQMAESGSYPGEWFGSNPDDIYQSGTEDGEHTMACYVLAILGQ